MVTRERLRLLPAEPTQRGQLLRAARSTAARLRPRPATLSLRAPATKAPPGLPRAQAATQALVLRSLANPTVHGPRPQAAPSIVTRLRKPVTPSLAEVLIKGPRAPLPALLAILALLRRLPAEPTQFGQLLRAAPPAAL